VHARVTADRDSPSRHAGADPFDAAAIALDRDLAVRGIARHVEELAERLLPVAVLHRQRGDRGRRFPGEGVGRDALGLDRDRGRAAVAEGEHDRVDTPWAVVSPTSYAAPAGVTTAR